MTSPTNFTSSFGSPNFAPIQSSSELKKGFLNSILSKELDQIQSFLEKAKNLSTDDKIKLLNNQNQDGDTALMTAARCGHVKVVHAILNFAFENGIVDHVINAQNKHGWTALMTAARCGHVKVVHAILNFAFEKGIIINLNAKTSYDRYTALVWAARCNHYEIVDEIFNFTSEKDLTHDDGIKDQIREALEVAASRGHIEIARAILVFSRENKIDIDPNSLQKTLINTASWGYIEIAHKILRLADEREITIDLKNLIDPLQRALLEAAKQSQYKTVSEILSFSRENKIAIDLNTRDGNGKTALILILTKAKK